MIDTTQPYGVSAELLRIYIETEGSLSAALAAIADAHGNTEILDILSLVEKGDVTFATWGIGAEL